jgi:glycosyltransferase involved in cell wall biosynthesis
VPDLVHDGRNGRTFYTGDIDGLTEALRRLIADSGLRRQMGAASHDIIVHWSYVECGAGLRTALARVGLGPAAAATQHPLAAN